MPVISLSRQFGAGGKTLGEMVANRLNFEFLDEALMHRLAEEANVSVQWVEGVAREAGGHLMRFLSTLVPSSFIERHVGDSGADFDEAKYVKFLSKVVEEVAEEDNVVILGRGSQFILRGNPQVVMVLLVAELEDRIKFIMEHYGLERGKAEAMVTRYEKMRTRFLKNLYTGNPNDPSLYHMVLNTSLISIETAENMICELVGSIVDKRAKPIWD